MDKQYEIDLLCFLIEVKKNKPFYKTHKSDIDFFIKVVKASINSESENPIKEKKKIGASEIGPYIIPIIHLIAELGHFLNSS
jgi:hypothetical protein